MNGTTPSRRRAIRPLDLAHALVNRRAPVYHAKLGRIGQPLREEWQRTQPDHAEVDAWEAGLGLLMVTGIVYDVWDYDPRHDEDGSGLAGFTEFLRQANPVIYLRVKTRSGGWHWYTAALGEPKCETIFQGVEYKGKGGCAFLPPTVRRSKDDRVKRGYSISSCNLDAPLKVCEALRSALAPSNGSGQGVNTGAVLDKVRGAPEGIRHEVFRQLIIRLQAVMSDEHVVAMCAPLYREMKWHVNGNSAEDDVRDYLAKGAARPVTPQERLILASLSPDDVIRPGGNTSRWHDFTALTSGEKRRPEATIFPREDGQCLFYAGREHNIYGETEAGKDMLLVAKVKWCLENELSVMWTDFEEGDEIEIGSRLLNAGLDPRLLNDRSWFRYATPATMQEADACLKDVVRWEPDVAIFDGVMAAYGVYGWQVKENDSATAFRGHLVRPCLARGIATIGSDHVTKDASGGRYAIGGVMKLNMVNGAAYLLENVKPIVRGGEGWSRLMLTKDRPSGIKPECAGTKRQGMLYAGALTVKSSGDGAGELSISVLPPQPGQEEQDSATVPVWLLEKVHKVFAGAGDSGLSKTAVANGWKGKGNSQVRLAVELLKGKGYLVPAHGSTSGQALRVGKAWDGGWEEAETVAEKYRAGIGTE